MDTNNDGSIEGLILARLSTETIPDGASFADLGMTSLDLLTLSEDIEEVTGENVDPIDFFGPSPVSAFIAKYGTSPK